MLEPLLGLLKSNDREHQKQGMMLLSTLAPKSDDGLTEGFTDILSGCSVSSNCLQLDQRFHDFDHEYQMHVALYMLNYIESPLLQEIKIAKLSVFDGQIPPLPFVEELELLLQNSQERCTEHLETVNHKYPLLQSLTFSGHQYRTGVLKIPAFPAPNLKRLKIDSPWILDGLEHYTHIKELTLSCHNDEIRTEYNSVKKYLDSKNQPIPSKESWYGLLQSFLDQVQLEKLTIRGIEKEYWSSLSLPSSIQNLVLEGTISSITKLYQLKNMQSLSLTAPLKSAAELLPLSFLKSLFLGNHSFIPPLLPMFEEHKTLRFEGPSWERLQSELRAYLDIAHKGVDAFVEGNQLQLGYNTLLCHLKGFHSDVVEELYLDWVDNLSSLEGLHMPKLRKLSLRGCRDIDFSALRNNPSIEVLDLTGSEARSLETLPPLPNLHTVLLDNSNIVSLGDIQLPGLRYFSATESLCLKDIQALKTAKNLEYLNLNQCIAVEDFSSISHCIALREIHTQSTLITRFPDISACDNLEVLTVKHSSYLEGFAGLPECNLQELDLSWCGCFEDTQSLLPLKKLKKLNFAWCRFVHDIIPLKSFTDLEQLIFWKNDSLPLELKKHHLRGSEIQEVLLQSELLTDGRRRISEWKSSLETEDFDLLMIILNDIFGYPSAIIHELLEGCSIDNSDLHAWEGFSSPYKNHILFQLFTHSDHPLFLESKVLVINDAQGFHSLNGIEKASGLMAVLVANSDTLEDISALSKLYQFGRGIDNAFVRPQLFLHNLSNLRDFSCLEQMQAMEIELWKLPHFTNGSQFGLMTGGYGLTKLRIIECGVVEIGDLSRLSHLHEYHIRDCPNVVSLGLDKIDHEIASCEVSNCLSLASIKGLDIANPNMETMDLISMPNLRSLEGLPHGLKKLRIEKSAIQDFQGIENLSQLQEIIILQDNIVFSTGIFSNLKELTTLQLESISPQQGVLDLREIIHSPQITKITIKVPKVIGLEVIGTLKNLTSITLTDPQTVFGSSFHMIEKLRKFFSSMFDNVREFHHSYDTQVIDGLDFLEHCTVVNLKLNAITESFDWTGLEFLHEQRLPEHLQSNGCTLTLTNFAEIKWPKPSIAKGIHHLVLGDADNNYSQSSVEYLSTFDGIQSFSNLKSLNLNGCINFHDVTVLEELKELSCIKWRNSFSGTCFRSSGIMGIYSEATAYGLQITSFSSSNRNDQLQIGDILVSGEFGPIQTAKDLPKVNAHQTHRFIILRDGQKMSLDVYYDDIRRLRHGERKWLLCGKELIQQWISTIQNPEQRARYVVWVGKSEVLSTDESIDFLVSYFQCNRDSVIQMIQNIEQNAIVSLVDSKVDISVIIEQAPAGLQIGSCVFEEFALQD